MQKKILRRVRIIFALKKSFRPVFVESYIFLFSLVGVFYMSSIFDVFENLSLKSGELEGFLRFSYSAFVNTELAVQALSLLAFFAIVFLLKDLARNLGGMLSSKTAR